SVTEVDCAADPCSLAVADLSDRVLASAPAPLPDEAEPPATPVLELSERDLDEDSGTVTVTGSGYPAGAVVRLAQCATTPDGGVDTENCLYDDGRRVVADSNGSVTTRLPVERKIALVGGGAADCAEPGACVVANARTDGVRLATVDLVWEHTGGASISVARGRLCPCLQQPSAVPPRPPPAVAGTSRRSPRSCWCEAPSRSSPSARWTASSGWRASGTRRSRRSSWRARRTGRASSPSPRARRSSARRRSWSSGPRRRGRRSSWPT